MFDTDKLLKVETKSVSELKENSEIKLLYGVDHGSLIEQCYEQVRQNLKLTLSSSLLPEKFIDKTDILKESIALLEQNNWQPLEKLWAEKRDKFLVQKI